MSCLHEWGVQQHTSLAPPPGPLGGAKWSNIIKYQLQSQFQRFLYQTLSVFSKMKDIKYIRGDCHTVTWAMPWRWDLWVLRRQKFNPVSLFVRYLLLNHQAKCNQTWCVSYSHERDVHKRIFGVKGSNIILQFQRHFKDFYTKFCVCSHKQKM